MRGQSGQLCSVRFNFEWSKISQGKSCCNYYNFLDAGSSATFCSEHLMWKLNIAGKGTNFHQQLRECPYAIRTQLGWAINGPLTRYDNPVEQQLPSATVNRVTSTTMSLMKGPERKQKCPEKITGFYGFMDMEINGQFLNATKMSMDSSSYNMLVNREWLLAHQTWSHAEIPM